MRRIVIAGGSIAGISAARQLRKSGFDGSITVADADLHGPYRRPAVSKAILTGHSEPADIAIEVPAELALEHRTGVQLTGLDVPGRTVLGHDREGSPVRLEWDGLVIATGSHARSWALGNGFENVHALRSVADGLRMRETLSKAGHITIVGGGFIGLEVASAARSLGVEVSLVEAAEVPLAHVLGPTLGRHIEQMHRDRGVRIRCGTTVTGLHGSGLVESVTLSDGQRIDTDLVLACVGSEPALGWLRSSGLSLGDGIICDRSCTVGDDGSIVAAGDVASWPNPLYGLRMRVEHWANAIDQGGFAALALLGEADPAGFSSVPYFWSEQCGTRIQSVGTTLGHDDSLILSRGDGESMMVGYGRAGRLTGVAGINVGRAVLSYRAKILAETSLESLAAGLAVQL
jgi:NADPH-dependent 2,4-dienoyl-CoA reductase/sulfur reductase-like enzyme